MQIDGSSAIVVRGAGFDEATLRRLHGASATAEKRRMG
jgi:hypothetical protein